MNISFFNHLMNFVGINNGVQALILNEQPLALYTHCFNHGLNLAISKAYLPLGICSELLVLCQFFYQHL